MQLVGYLVQLPGGRYRLIRGTLRQAAQVAARVAEESGQPSAIRPAVRDFWGQLQPGDTSHVADPDGTIRREVSR